MTGAPRFLRVAWGRAHAVAHRLLGRPGPAKKLLDHIIALAAAEADATPMATPFVALIVPVFDAKPRYLDALTASVRAQRKGAWRLILSDDGSSDPATKRWLDAHGRDGDLTVLRSEANRGIAAATNAGLAAATTPWVGFLDHDDALAPHALDRIGRALAGDPECAFLYTDEVVCDGKLEPVELFLKPAFDPVLLSGVNYVNHLSLYRRERLMALGGLREGYEGSQDYECLLRYTAGLSSAQCRHLPYPAYLWRRDGASYSVRHIERATRNARRAIGERFAAGGVAPMVGEAIDGGLHRVRFDAGRAHWPLVSVIIPNKNSPALIRQALDGLVKGTDYPNLEILVVDNGTTDAGVLALYARMESGPARFRAIVEAAPFNFARAVNRGAALAKGEAILLLNNDIEIREPLWLKEMVSCLAFPDVGIVGAKLLYPDLTMQHAGVMVGFGGLAGHWYLNETEDYPGPMGRLWVRQSMSAVTGACFLFSRALLEKIGPFDETLFAIAYNDVDFCMRAIAAGFRVVWTPFACCIHHESASRGSDETPANIGRFHREQDNLRRRHATDAYQDFAISPWYSKDRSVPRWVPLPKLPDPR